MAGLEGILLDSLYSEKAMARLIGTAEAGELKRASNVLFVYTGQIHALNADPDRGGGGMRLFWEELRSLAGGLRFGLASRLVYLPFILLVSGARTTVSQLHQTMYENDHGSDGCRPFKHYWHKTHPQTHTGFP